MGIEFQPVPEALLQELDRLARMDCGCARQQPGQFRAGFVERAVRLLQLAEGGKTHAAADGGMVGVLTGIGP